MELKALFDSLPPEDYKNGVLVLGGDGRYFNLEAAQVFKFNTEHCKNECGSSCYFRLLMMFLYFKRR